MPKHTTIALLLNLAILLINTDATYFSPLCKLEDSVCVKKTAQAYISVFTAGIPEYNVEPCDPLYIEKLDLSSPGLKLKLTDAKVTGLKNSIINNISVNEVKKTLTIKLQSTFYLEGHYVMDGKLVLLPLKGKGLIHAILREMEITAHGNLKYKVGQDGKSHWIFEYKSHSFALKDKSDVEFENIFGGDTVLGNAAKDVLADSGNAIVEEVGDPVVKAVMDAILLRMNAIFDKIPVDELRLK